VKSKIFFSHRTFSLVEVMVAAVVLLVGIAGLLFVFISCRFLNETNDNLITAAVDAQNILEQIRNLDYFDISGYTPPSLNHLNNQQVFVTPNVGDKITEVTVDVSWQERGRQRNFFLTTWIAP